MNVHTHKHIDRLAIITQLHGHPTHTQHLTTYEHKPTAQMYTNTQQLHTADTGTICHRVIAWRARQRQTRVGSSGAVTSREKKNQQIKTKI